MFGVEFVAQPSPKNIFLTIIDFSWLHGFPLAPFYSGFTEFILLKFYWIYFIQALLNLFYSSFTEFILLKFYWIYLPENEGWPLYFW